MLVGIGKREHSSIAGRRTNYTVILEISVFLSQEIGNYPASRPNYTTPEHIRKGLSNLPQGHLLNYMHDSFIHNIQKLKMASMSLN